MLEVLQNEELDSADGVVECEKAIDRVMGVIKYKNEGMSQPALAYLYTSP